MFSLISLRQSHAGVSKPGARPHSIDSTTSIASECPASPLARFEIHAQAPNIMPRQRNLLLRALVRLAQAIQDSRRREAEIHLAHYRELTRDVSDRWSDR
jgi:hypothetical protein